MRKEYEIDQLGIENDKSPLSEKPSLDSDSYNLVSSEIQGTGPRWGMSLIPGQGHTETGAENLRSSEGTTSGYSARKRVFGLGTQKLLRSGASLPMPFALCASERALGTIPETYQTTLDFCLFGDTSGADSDIAAKILNPTLGALDNGLKNWRLKSLTARTIDATMKSIRFAQLNIGLSDVQTGCYLADCVSGETASVAGALDMSLHGYDYKHDSKTWANLKVLTTFTSSLKEYFGRSFVYDSNANAISGVTKEYLSASHLILGTSSRQQQRITTPSYSGVGERALILSDDIKFSSSHAVIAMATGKKALLVILRDEKDADGLTVQYYDPTVERLASVRTIIEGTTNSYKENGQDKSTGWVYVPDYSAGTPLGAESSAAYNGEIHIRLGAANSGLLRKGLVYEAGYSFYDVTTGTETNVCKPFRFETGTDDFVAFSVFRNEKAGGLFSERVAWGMNIPVQKPAIEKVNYWQYRFYYRALGSQEWLPAGQIWAADLLFNGQNQVVWLGRAAIGASVGGAVGQFNDFSALPDEKWRDVCIFQNRFFWVSEKMGIFSLRNNALAYPARNSISLPTGEFRGITPHVFYGQSEQTGRVVLWASDGQYEGRFTNQPVAFPVSVSPDFIAQFPLDGSDFIVQFRSSITAFSSRAAVVAEGALFFWGESGIYADSGVQPPNKISGPIEPWLGDLYDPTQSSSIHCVYNDKTKEIIWFYKPKTLGSFVSEALCFNAEKQAFTRFGFQTDIDWAQSINLSQEGARKRLACGKRLVIGHSFALYPQRACFFDEKNNTGDLRHGREFMVQEVQQLPVGSRLVLAFGFDVSSFADISVGDELLISQSHEYTENESSYNGRYTITDIGQYYLDIAETLDAATFTDDKLLHIWIDKFSNIPFKLRTRFITPGDRWTVYSYSFIALSLRIPQTIYQDFEAGMFSNLNTTATFQTINVSQNATKHCIRALSYPQSNESTDGIGFGLELKGNANGASWRIDWLGVVGRESEDLTRFGQGE